MTERESILADLAKVRFPAVLGRLGEERRDGLLTVRGPSGAKKIVLSEGDVLAVASSQPDERIGAYLVRWGVVTDEELMSLLAHQRGENRGLGELVVARRLLEPEAMRRVLRIRAEDALFDMAGWHKGTARWAASGPPTRDYLEMRVSIGDFLARLDRLAMAGLMRPGDVPAAPPGDLERGAALAVDGRRSLAEIAALWRCSLLDAALRLSNAAVISKTPPTTSTPADGTPRSWEQLLDDAETALSFADLVDAHDLLVAALEAGGTTSAAQGRALALEAAIRERLEIEDDAVVLASPGVVHGSLDNEERWIVAGADQPRTVGELVRLSRTDSLRARVVISGLLASGVLRLGEHRREP